ncbi:MAG: 4-(cytidine 5'-diphospho)-2-C-methyl-D-erythritol kinase [Prevotella sp.]|nr:4-(cytidine 5'-diphospho)-2-C-methyl-D-erythritol kinase [Prevotella sp.]
MKIYPCAKINIGLNVVGKRPDGYHNLETIFYPIPLTDELEIDMKNTEAPSHAELELYGNPIKGNPQDNLIIRAYNILAKDFKIAPVKIRLKKNIPTEAGLGGGSSDAASTLILLNKLNNLNLSANQLIEYAAKLGADCSFFIESFPSYATGIGDRLEHINITNELKDKWIILVKPDISISTREAYSGVQPKKADACCKDAIMQPISTWNKLLTNDFEKSIFERYPRLSFIKNELYKQGAIFSQMSGSGSTIYGIFNEKPSKKIESLFNDDFVTVLPL